MPFRNNSFSEPINKSSGGLTKHRGSVSRSYSSSEEKILKMVNSMSKEQRRSFTEQLTTPPILRPNRNGRPRRQSDISSSSGGGVVSRSTSLNSSTTSTTNTTNDRNNRGSRILSAMEIPTSICLPSAASKVLSETSS